MGNDTRVANNHRTDHMPNLFFFFLQSILFAPQISGESGKRRGEIEERQTNCVSHHAHLAQVIIFRFRYGNNGKFQTVLVEFKAETEVALCECEKSFFLAIAVCTSANLTYVCVCAQCNSDFGCLSYQ